MAIDLERGYGAIPYGHGLYGYGLTLEGENDATVTPLDLDLEPQSLGGSSGVSAVVEVAELVVAGQAAKAGAIRQLPDTVEWSKP